MNEPELTEKIEAGGVLGFDVRMHSMDAHVRKRMSKNVGQGSAHNSALPVTW